MKLRIRVVMFASCLMVALAFSLQASVAQSSKNCGYVGGNKIVTSGGLSCKTAKNIYNLFQGGKKVPKGWNCGLSAGSCFKGKKGFTFKFN